MLSEAAALAGGTLSGGDTNVVGVSTDTRTLQNGQLFVALRGDKFDGHDYAQQAQAANAAAVLVERPVAVSLPQVLVDDTRLALGRLAAGWRQRFSVPIIGVTGSNGKTTVKEMIASIMGQRGRGLVTRGNFNNDIGVPLTLLRMSEDDGFAVIEMGANHRGEIAYLTGLVRPDVAVITNAGPAHLEGFGSVEDVVQAKGEIFRGLGPEGTAVINADDPHAATWLHLAQANRIVTFGMRSAADVRTDPAGINSVFDPAGLRNEFTLRTPAGEVHALLHLAGQHNVINALAAAAAAHAAGADLDAIAHGLAGVAPAGGRLNVHRLASGVCVIDDSYNANPASFRAAIDVLVSAPGERTLVLGDMMELGEGAARLHRELGAVAKARGVDRVLAVGNLSRETIAGFGDGGEYFDKFDVLVARVQSLAAAGNGTLLVKGSRSMRMERVVTALLPQGVLEQGGGSHGGDHKAARLASD